MRNILVVSNANGKTMFIGVNMKLSIYTGIQLLFRLDMLDKFTADLKVEHTVKRGNSKIMQHFTQIYTAVLNSTFFLC